MISRERIEAALRVLTRQALAGSNLTALQEVADQKKAAAMAEANGIKEETQAKFLEAAKLEHQLRFAPLKKILNGYRDDIKYFRDRYAPSSRIFTWECYEQEAWGPDNLPWYRDERSCFYTEGFFLEEPTFDYPHPDSSKGVAFTIQSVLQQNRLRQWQQVIRQPRKERTFVLARLQNKGWTGIVYPLWEHVATKV